MCEGWNNEFFNLVGHAHLPSYHRTVWSCRRCCKEAPSQAAVSFAMMLIYFRGNIIDDNTEFGYLFLVWS
jgi:hypothetical protein